MSVAKKVNFLFIGPDKSGSTWLYEALGSHGSVAVPSAKELFFFDRFYSFGYEWYEGHFPSDASSKSIVAEVCHDYLYSDLARSRIRNDLGCIKLMVCLREPRQRAISAFQYMLKQGRVKGGIDNYLSPGDELVEHGLYGKYLVPYIREFGRDNIYIGVFDDLQENPQRFYDELCDFLEIERRSLPESLIASVLPAQAPRSRFVAKVARSSGWMVRSLGFPKWVQAAKGSRVVKAALYRAMRADEKPVLSKACEDRLVEIFGRDISILDSEVGTNLASRWGYTSV